MLSVFNDLSCYTNCIFYTPEIRNCPNFHSVAGNKKYLYLIKNTRITVPFFIRKNLFLPKLVSFLL